MLLELLESLTSLHGPCGHEHDVARFIADRVKSQGGEVTVDGIGNVILTKRGAKEGPTLVVSTHMDEVGFIVKKIERNGLIRFEKLGGHDDRILLAQEVVIRTDDGYVPGVIGTISAHMAKFDEAKRVRGHAEMYIDIGAADADEVRALGVQVGHPIAWATQMKRIGLNRVVGKSFDDRAGCAVLLSAMEHLDFSQVAGTVHAVFSVQEEVGLRGARVAAHQLKADVALAVDTTAVSDTPEQMMDDTLFLGKGPGIKVMDFSLIASVAVHKALQRVAQASGIPYQLEVFPGIGTDAGELSMGQGGVPTGALSIPSRYAHSPVEVIDIRDLENTQKLLEQFILSFQSDTTFSFI